VAPGQTNRQRPRQPEHPRQKSQRQADGEKAASHARVDHADDQRQQAPGGDVVDGGAGKGIAPMRVPCSPRSVRIRARTGKAVTDIATPENSAKMGEGDVARREPRVENQSQRRAQQERGHDAGVGNGHRGVGSSPEHPEIELQTDQEHVEDHAHLGEDRQEGRNAGPYSSTGRAAGNHEGLAHDLQCRWTAMTQQKNRGAPIVDPPGRARRLSRTRGR
jgi:hypothetical protein